MAKKRSKRTEIKRYLKQAITSLELSASYFTEATRPLFPDYPITEKGHAVVMETLLNAKDLMLKIHEGF